MVTLVACGSSTTGDPGTSSGTTSGATASGFTSSCEKSRQRATSCFGSDAAKVKKEGDEDCAQIDACYAKIYRSGIAEEVAACIAVRECAQGYGKCLDTIAEAHQNDDGVASFLATCDARAKACNEPQNTYLMRTDCLEYALVANRPPFEACLAKPCKEIGKCLGDTQPACDR